MDGEFREKIAMKTVTALDRARCRIPWGEAREDGDFWEGIPGHNFFKLGANDLPLAATTFRAVAGERSLHVRFDCVIEDWFAAVANINARPGLEREHVYCEIFPKNDPTEVWRITGGMTRAGELPPVTCLRRINGEASLGASYDEWSLTGPRPGRWHRVETSWGVSPQAWWLEWTIPWRSIGLEERPVTMGFQYGRGEGACPRDPLVLLSGWPHGHRPSSCPPLLEHGEALIGPKAGAPARVEFDQPVFGRNCGRMILENDWPTAPGLLRVRSLDPEGGAFAAEEFVIADGTVPFEFRLDRAHSSHLHVDRMAGISLEVFDAGGQVPLYQARLPLDRHLGLCVDEPYEVRADILPSGTLRERWLDRVVRALPRLRRATTEQGASSDFCLMFADGSLAVNLMADDPWRPLVALIEEHFAGTEDRLVAAMALVGQKSVTNLLRDSNFFDAKGRHTYHSPQHELTGPLSVMRFGGGSAMCRASVLAALLQRMGGGFVTRVVGLSLEGGPVQTTRKYRGCEGTPGLAPFVQEPGRVGAVAVDYRGSQTVLDPTALAFFPRDDGRLATVEEITDDGALRVMGAGRLAAVYGGLDLEELRRQPTDRLLAKGVLPELAPDEDGTDLPPSAGECFVPRVVMAGAPASRPEPWCDAMGVPGCRHGSVLAESTEAGLRVTVEVKGLDPRAFDARDREMEAIHIVLDSSHGHRVFFHFQAGLAGTREAWIEEATGIQRLLKHLSTENHIELGALPAEAWSCGITQKQEGYLAVFMIPWACLELADGKPPVLGFNAWITGRHPHYEQVFFAPPRFRAAADPLTFADLYLEPGNLRVVEADFGTPFWGGNEGSLTLANSGSRDLAVEVRSLTRLKRRRWIHPNESVMVTVPAGATMTVRFPYLTNPEEKWSDAHRLEVALLSEGQEWFRGQWSMNFAYPVTIRHRYGSELGARTNASPGEPGFLQRKIDYVCSRIPLFHRLTTRQGAASDFVLRAEEGSAEWNLMQHDALDQMARFIEGRFDNDFDRLLGMFYLSLNPAIKRHQSAGHRFLTGAGPLSVIRASFAGIAGNCNYAALVFAGMADRLVLGEKKLTTHPNGLVDHVVSAVNWDGKHIILDADLGHFSLKADGRDFATIEDFRNSAEILSTAGPLDRLRYYFFRHSRTSHQLPYDYAHYPGVFPAAE